MPDPTVPPFHGNISFHAQHSPMGAFFSFTCGQFGSRGGFGFQIGKPGNQNLYIGVKDGDRFSDAPLKCLPFYEGADADEAARFDVEKKTTGEKKPAIVSYARHEIQRHYGWASDTWVTPDFEFAIYTPCGPINDPSQSSAEEIRLQIVPAIWATLTIDNRSGQTEKTAIFGLRFGDQGVRILDDEATWLTRKGFAWGRSYGVMGELRDPAEGGEQEQRETHVADQLQIGCRWSPVEAVNEAALHRLGNCPVLLFTVPPGEQRVLRLTLGAYAKGVQTTRIEGRYWYARHFGGLEDVLSSAFDQADGRTWAVKAVDQNLTGSDLSPDQQFMIAHATRSYYGSTQLLDVGGEPFWIVNEGEYCMLNTLDLSVDQVFWELKQNPWVVNLLDNFVRHYSYVDQHGLSFCHDMGVHNNFSPKGHSSYELPNLNAACFSYMTCEELCNWILIAACYVHKTGDQEWLMHNAHVVDACLTSLANRGRDVGYVQFDSSRCGQGGAEITTYDSLDHSLAQTRNNVYMAVKCWACYLGLANLLENVQPERAKFARDKAKLVELNVLKFQGADGVFPAVFEKQNSGFHSKILPAIEGLMYPLYWGLFDTPWAGRLNEGTVQFVDALKQHTVVLLKGGKNLFPDGGIKLSSTSNNSWMSKIAIFMHICRKVFKLHEDPEMAEIFRQADAAHVKWQTEGESAYWACSDQFINGVAKGSKYYPRIITAALWMEE